MPELEDYHYQGSLKDDPKRRLSSLITKLGTRKASGLVMTLVLAIMLPVVLVAVQMQQNVKQRASELGMECRRCSNTNIGKMAIFRCEDASQAATLGPIQETSVTYVDDPACLANNSAICAFEKIASIPEWAKGNDSLGNGDYCGPVAGQSRPAACGEEIEGWVPGPPLNAGASLGLSGKSPNWAIPIGGKLPVMYDSKNDITSHAFNDRAFGESNWSRFLRRLDDSYFGTYSSQVASNDISTGAIIKYEIIRVARDSVHYLTEFKGDINAANEQIAQYQRQSNGQDLSRGENVLVVTRNIKNAEGKELKGEPIDAKLLSQVTGFDVTSLDLTQWTAADQDERMRRLFTETSSCTNKPDPEPVSKDPVNCEEKLQIPPTDFKTEFPPYTRNVPPQCDNLLAPGTVRNELTVCGDYWVSGWCNNQRDATTQNTAMFACRGWSQQSNQLDGNGNAIIDNKYRFLLYYSNRIRTLSGETLKSNTRRYGDALGRKITWNSLMRELKEKGIAYPYEHDNANKTREEVRNNALNAAAQAFFNKSWGALKEQERLNNCPITTWDTPQNANLLRSERLVVPTMTRYTINGQIFIDTNRNKVKDVGETTYPYGATVTMGDQKATSNASGQYTFATTVVGTQTVTLDVPAAYTVTTTNPVTFTSANNVTVNFGIVSLPTSTPSPTPTVMTSGSSIVVYAEGTVASGVYPTMDLYVNGTLAKRWTDVTGGIKAYSYTSPTKVTASALRIRFANDAKDYLRREDRNLHVVKLVLNGIDYPTKANTVYGDGVFISQNGCASGYIQGEWINCNGYFQFK